MLSRWDESFGTLIVHFSHRFFDTDSPSEESVPRNRLVQFLALVAVASPMLMILVIRGVQGVLIRTGGDFSWLQASVHYTFVCYAMAVMGLVMTIKWDDLFPNRRDYLILASLPISATRLFAAKATAVGFILLLFTVATNAVLIVLATFMEPGAFLGHVFGILGASIFAVLFFAALQGLLINLLPTKAFRRISPSVQMIAIALLITLVLVLPLVAVSLKLLVQINTSLLDYFPPVWFLGVYESLNSSATAIPKAGVWAWTAVKMTILMTLVVGLSYVVGYRRHARKVVESLDSNDLVPRLWERNGKKLLHAVLQTNAFQRAAFDFIGKISARSPKHRISSALFSGLGLALALSSLFVIDPRAAFPIRLSASGILEAAPVLSFLAIAGWRSTFSVPYELPANWVFQMTGRTGAADFRKAIRKWLFVCRIVPLYILLACLEFAWFDAGIAVTHLAFDLITTAFLVEAFFFGFRKVPFTCAHLQGKLQLAFYAIAYLYAYTAYTSLMGDLKRWTSADPQHLIRFMSMSAIAFGGILIYRSLTGAERSKFIYDEQEPVYQQLNLS
jgi:hypothetical protein